MNVAELIERYNAGERNFAGVPQYGICSELTTINLSNIILSGAQINSFSRTNLRGAQLVGISSVRGGLAEADLSGADLTGANLTEAWLNGANLRGAKLIGANLTGAKLIGADLTGADLSESILCQVVGLAKIKLDEECHRQVILTNALLWQTYLPDGTFVSSPRYHE